MMTISEFAMATGLNAKTLRFYDERGILAPAEVDQLNGYRLYSASQMRDATAIRILRATGMSLEQVAACRAEPARLGAIVQAHRTQLAAERAHQNRALALADALLPNLEVAQEPQTRSVGATHWAAIAFPIDLNAIEGGDDPQTEEANEAFGLLYTALVEAENPPIGTFWTSMPTQMSADHAELLLSWPVAAPVPPGFTAGGHHVRTGTLPARTEAFIEVSGSAINEDMLDDLAGGRLADPHFIAFSEYLEAHDCSPAELRQTSRGERPENWTTEYSATISVD